MIYLSTTSRCGFTVTLTVPMEQDEKTLSKFGLWYVHTSKRSETMMLGRKIVELAVGHLSQFGSSHLRIRVLCRICVEDEQML